MAALALAVWMTPEKVWEPLSSQERDNFGNWLRQINSHRISDNNWLFFRVLVNCALRHAGSAYSEEQLRRDLDRVDEFYLGEGWYSDGMTKQRPKTPGPMAYGLWTNPWSYGLWSMD